MGKLLMQGTTDLLRLILQSTKMTQRLRSHIKAGPTGEALS